MRMLILSVCLVLRPSILQADTVTTFDDIVHWVGAGANEAGFVVDWNTGSPDPVSFAWGYRWDGAATGEDMFLAIVQADPRLFAKVSAPGGFGRAVYGIGYDDGDGSFALDDETSFPTGGLAVTGSSDNANAIGVGDFYEEGWLSEGFWSYNLSSDTNPFDGAGNDWGAAGTGMSGRNLSDGDWDGWSYAPGFASTAPSIPQASAVPEPNSLAGLLVGGCAALVLRRKRKTNRT